MSDRIEEQIRKGLQLLAEEVELPARSRKPVRRSRNALVLAFAVVAVAVSGVIVATRGGGSSTPITAPPHQEGSPFLPDNLDYHSAPLTFLRSAKFASGSGYLGATAQSDVWISHPAVDGVIMLPGGWYNAPFISQVSASSGTDAWIVGTDWRHSRAVSWHWDGGHWRAVPVPDVRSLLSVATTADGAAWAVGPGVIAHWDGTQWHATRIWHHEIPNLVSVSASAQDNVWAVGSRGAKRPVLLQWNGHAWSPVGVPWGEKSGYPSKIVTTGPTDVWVITETGIEHWDGQSWQRVPRPFGKHDPTFHFSAAGADDAWAVGSYVLRHHFLPLAAHWNGHKWEIARSQRRGQDSAFTDVVAIGPNDAWAVAQRAWKGYYAGERVASSVLIDGYGGFGGYGGYGRTFFEHWNGHRWTVMPGVRPRYSGGATALAASSDGHAWAIGDCFSDNMIAGWNGYIWRVRKHPPDQHWPGWERKRQRRHGFPHCHVVSP